MVQTNDTLDGTPFNALLQASIDVVVDNNGQPHFVDFNRFQEGFSLHLLNDRPAVETAFADAVRGMVEGQRVHLVANPSWPQLTYGAAYGPTIRYLLEDIARAADVTETYGLKGIGVNDGMFKVGNEARTIFYYRDFEAKHAQQHLNADIKRLYGLAQRIPDLSGSLARQWINWPTACWCPANMPIDALMTKSGIYGTLDNMGIRTPAHAVVSDRQPVAELREVLYSMLDNHETVIAKPDKVGGRAVGVEVIHDREKADSFVGSISGQGLEQWLIEGHIPRDVLHINGKRIIYDLIPLVIGDGAVSTFVKYTVIENGRIHKMPGQNPAVIMFPKIEGSEHLAERAASLMDAMGFKGRDAALENVRERARQFGAVEGPEAEALREHFRSEKGLSTLRTAEAGAAEVKKALMTMVRDKTGVLHGSLERHLFPAKARLRTA